MKPTGSLLVMLIASLIAGFIFGMQASPPDGADLAEVPHAAYMLGSIFSFGMASGLFFAIIMLEKSNAALHRIANMEVPPNDADPNRLQDAVYKARSAARIAIGQEDV